MTSFSDYVTPMTRELSCSHKLNPNQDQGESTSNLLSMHLSVDRCVNGHQPNTDSDPAELMEAEDISIIVSGDGNYSQTSAS